MQEIIAISIKGTQLRVMELPPSKKKCLCLQKGNEIIKLASFVNEECVKEYYRFLGMLADTIVNV